ncbi:MAG: hypothetical protein HC906_09765 [Bacteroidales bacterium]|nr:hypothetical protein [Bacteroidales bacterium]
MVTRLIALNNFTISDAEDNILNINGNVNYSFTDPVTFDLTADADDFTLINTTEDSDNPYYGRVIADLDASISGTANRPVVNVNVGINEESEFYYTIVNTGEINAATQGIVEFIEKDTLTSSILNEDEDADIAENELELDLTANIAIDENALFKVIIDPITNENLTVKGEGNLSFSMKPGNIMTLTGRYEINEGSYMLSFYNVVKRNFEIDEGSYLSWSGDIMEADANIAAIYRVKTSPLGLVADQLQQISESEREQFNDPSPFLVYLNIQEDLLSPEISFNIEMPEEERNAVVEAKLNQLNQNPSELNKQVFSLLLFKNFYRNPLFPPFGIL